MNANYSYISRTAGLLAGALLAVSAASAADSKSSDAFPSFDNYVIISGQGTSLSGSKPAAQARTQVPTVGAVGVEELYLTKELSKETSLTIDGRALPGAEDYLAHVRITKTDVGSFEAGYKQFRTFYDGAGGFFPINNAWLPLYSRSLYVDRAKAFANVTIASPNMPVFTFSYANETRTGRKESTIWGDTDQTGIPISSASALNPISANRKIVPAYINLDERNEQMTLSVKHTVGKTTGSVSITSTRTWNNDRRTVDRYPGELKPYPAIPSNPPVWVTPVQANNQNKGFDAQHLDEDGLSIMGKLETVLSEKVKVYVRGLWRKSDQDIRSERLISGAFKTNFGVQDAVGSFTTGGRPPYSYTGAGHIKEQVYTGVFGVETMLLPNLSLNAAIRAEQLNFSGYNNTDYVNYLVNQATSAVKAVPVSTTNGAKVSDKPVTPEIQVRYTGIKTVALYTEWEYRSATGTENKSYIGISPSGNVIIPSPSTVNENVKEKHNNWKIGASWTPKSFFTGRAELFTKDHEDSFRGYGTEFGDYYILDYDIYGARLSAIIKPMPGVVSTTRYVQQVGKAKTVGDAFASGDANNAHRYQISETIDWTPNKSVYLQGNLNFVFDTTNTAYPAGLTATDVLHDANNNYWNGSIITGFVVDKNTDAEVQATYYKADNYNAALAGSTVPYGAGVRDYSLTVGVKHRFTDRMIGSAKIGYLNSESEMTGGFSDYNGMVGYVSLAYRL